MSDPPVPPPPPESERWSSPDPGSAVPGAGQPPGLPAYATWGQRALAALLDALFGFVAFIAVFIVASIVSFIFGIINDTLGGLIGGLIGIAGYFGVLIVLMLTEAGPYGQTPGKHIIGVRVLDTSGRTLSKGLAVGRYFAKIISGLPCYVGYLWPLWDAEKRTFHDMIVNTRVVHATSKAPSLAAIVQAPFTGPPHGESGTL